MIKLLKEDGRDIIESQEQFDRFCDILENEYSIPSAGQRVERPAKNMIRLTDNQTGCIDEFVLMGGGQIIHYMKYPDEDINDAVAYNSMEDCLMSDESSVIYFIYVNDFQTEILGY